MAKKLNSKTYKKNISLLVTGFFLGGIILYLVITFTNYIPISYIQPNQKEQVYKAKNATSEIELVDRSCNKDGCLYSSGPDTVIGYGKIKGYYRQVEKNAWNQTKMCDTLVITEGNQTLIDHFKELIKDMNYINSLDEKNNVLLTINLSDLPIQDKQHIQSSSYNTPVELGVITKIGSGATDVPVCYSLIDIVLVR